MFPAEQVFFISGGTVVSIDSLVMAPSSNFIITGPNAFTKNAFVTHLTSSNYVQRVFHFSSTLASFSGAIGIYYRNAELNGLAASTLTLNVHDGVSWNAYAANVTRDATNNLVTTTGLSNISLNELTLAGLSSPLPLSFTFFNAFCNGSSITLSWKTAQEFNTNVFEIERSADGRHWQLLGKIAAAGYSSAGGKYTWMDSLPLPTALYRIVETDIDRRIHISSVIRSSCSVSELLTTYPNPVHDAATIYINLSRSATVTLRLYDAKGSLMKQTQANLSPGANLIQLDMTTLAAGTYNLIARWSTNRKAVKIIKE